MPAARCSNCAINYPESHAVCLACGDPTWRMSNGEPDGNWATASSRLKDRFDEGEDSIYPHKSGTVCRIYRGKGQLWATHAELLACGYSNLEADTVIYVNDTFYELEGYAEAARAWWLREVVTEGAAENLKPSMFLDGDTASA